MKKVILCGELFDAATSGVRKDMAIVVDGNKIAGIEPAAAVDKTGCEVVDLSDKFVMPGLIDTHVHVYFDGLVDGFEPFPHQQHGEILLDSMLRAQRDLLAGFTSIRDCGCGKFGTDISLRNYINAGKIHGPRMCISGGMIVTSAMQNTYTDGAYTCNGPEEVRAAARDTLGKGCDQVKLMVTIGILSNGSVLGACVMTYEEIKAACDTARSLGAITSAHAHGVEGIQNAVRAGITSIEHAVLLDEPTAEMMAEAGTYLVPTLVSGEKTLALADELPPHVLEKERFASDLHRKAIGMAYRKGVKLAFGTDCGTPGSRHGEQADEFRLMVEAGVSVEDALLSATRSAAEMMQWADRVGTIEAGKLADIVAFDVSPFADINTMKNCTFVMKDGTIYKGPNAIEITLG
ncbi:MAG: amidohydrolase family protein [Bradyrhizobium sp.]